MLMARLKQRFALPTGKANESARSDYTSVPIGKPIFNTRIYILDSSLHLLPVGIPGELCVGGVSLARGYLNRPELTNEKFVTDPFKRLQDSDSRSYGVKIYKTGDLARWFDDGNIEFLGRIDQQVKIRGFRVEPDEIRFWIRKHESVKDAVVIDRKQSDGEIYLCAYVVPESTGAGQDDMPDFSSLRNYLSAHLPDYMIPVQFISISEVPFNASGKVDRKALPLVGFGSGESYVAPGG